MLKGWRGGEDLRKASKVRTLSVMLPFFSPKNSSFIVALEGVLPIMCVWRFGGFVESCVRRGQVATQLRRRLPGAGACSGRSLADIIACAYF